MVTDACNLQSVGKLLWKIYRKIHTKHQNGSILSRGSEGIRHQLIMEVGTNIRENQPTSVEVGTNIKENQPTSMEVGTDIKENEPTSNYGGRHDDDDGDFLL